MSPPHHSPPNPRAPSYYDEEDVHEDLQTALARESKLEIRKPTPFTGRDRRKWNPFVMEILNNFFAKPHIYGTEQAKIAFAASWLQDTALAHYTSLLKYRSDDPALRSWDAFVQEFARMFGIVNVQTDAEQHLRGMQMGDREHFSQFVVRFEEYSYDTNWNEAALRSELYRCLPTRIKEVMKLADRPTTYNDLRTAAMRIDQRHWEYESEEARRVPRYTSNYSNPPSRAQHPVQPRASPSYTPRATLSAQPAAPSNPPRNRPPPEPTPSSSAYGPPIHPSPETVRILPGSP